MHLTGRFLGTFIYARHPISRYNKGIRTWRGDPSEEWSSAQGLESILISIQSLMSSNPFENEPGFETNSAGEHTANIAHYIAKVNHLLSNQVFRYPDTS